MPDPSASPVAPSRTPGRLVGALVVAGLVAVAVWSWSAGVVPRVSEETVQTSVWTAIQREAPEQFLIVGTLDVGTEAEARSTTRVLPGMLDLAIGETTARVRVPGRAAYGFDVRQLRPRDIRYTSDGVVIVTLPALSVFSVEPRLEDAEISVDAGGWQRLSRTPERAAVRSALAQVRPAIRRQAEAHLADNDQPRRNAARAVEGVIRTPLEAAGVEGARFRFVVAPGDTLDLPSDQ
jgi:hypothetical protein